MLPSTVRDIYVCYMVNKIALEGDLSNALRRIANKTRVEVRRRLLKRQQPCEAEDSIEEANVTMTQAGQCCWRMEVGRIAPN